MPHRKNTVSAAMKSNKCIFSSMGLLNYTSKQYQLIEALIIA